MGVFTEVHDRIFDRDGQPLAQALRADASQERLVDELIGLVKGVLADGALCEGEVEFLYRWLETNREIASYWPANVIYPRIAAALADGHVDAQEEQELMGLLLSMVGGNTAPLQGQRSDGRPCRLLLTNQCGQTSTASGDCVDRTPTRRRATRQTARM